MNVARQLTDHRILVTGAGGLLGGHVVRQLVEAGARPVALMRRAPTTPLEADLVIADVRDGAAMVEACRDVDIVIHAAGMAASPLSAASPLEAFNVNLNGTLHIAEACRLAGVKRLVALSSAHVYGNVSEAGPVAEDTPLNGTSPYAASKVAAETVLNSYRKTFGLPVVILRPFNVFGPNQIQDALIPTIVRQAVEGDVVRLQRLDPIRDFCFVDDGARGILAAAAAPDAVGRTINLCEGVGHSVEQIATLVINRVRERTGREIELVAINPPSKTPDSLIGDPGQARRLLNWSPDIGLADGLARTVDDWARRLDHPRWRAAGS